MAKASSSTPLGSRISIWREAVRGWIGEHGRPRPPSCGVLPTLEVLSALGAASLRGDAPTENKIWSVPWLGWAGLGLARLDVPGCVWAVGGEVLFSVSGCGHRALVGAAHLRNGELGGLRGLIAAKVNHCATLGHVVHPEAFKQLTVVQVEETARPILHASLPVALVAVPVLWGKGQGHLGAGHT